MFYERGALSFARKGFVKLSGLDLFIKTNQPAKNVHFARIVPCGNHIVVEIGYETQYPTNKIKSGKVAGLDIGLNNLAAICSNVAKPLLINGRPLKSINQYFNKHKALEDSKLDKKIKTNPKKKQALFLKRKHKIADYLHKASRYVVNHLVSNQIDTLVIGKNKGWKQDINIGSKGNQNFVSIPFNNFIEQITYKARMHGIEVICQEESYTSKCSFFDNEDVKKHEKYMGSRTKRGLFKTSQGKQVNADINGALNILKKYLITKESWNDQIRSDLVEASSTPHVLKHTPAFN